MKLDNLNNCENNLNNSNQHLDNYNPDLLLDDNNKEVSLSENNIIYNNEYNPDNLLDMPEKNNDENIDNNKKDNEKNDYNPDDLLDNNDEIYNSKLDKEKNDPIKNKQDGIRREEEVKNELKEKYSEDEYNVLSEEYLRDNNGNIVKDQNTNSARRIDFVVIKDNNVIDCIEVTSKTADKTEQIAKENRIRENGGNYIRDDNGNLIKIPDDLKTRIERRD